MLTYQNSYIEFGFIKAMDNIRPECVICIEKFGKWKYETQGVFPQKKDLVVPSRPHNMWEVVPGPKATKIRWLLSALSWLAKKPRDIGETLIQPACIKMAEIIKTITDYWNVCMIVKLKENYNMTELCS